MTFPETVVPPFHPDGVLNTVADANGNIDTSRPDTPLDDYELEGHDLGVTYVLTAQGWNVDGSPAEASTTFTDSAISAYDQCSNDLGSGYTSGGDQGCRWIDLAPTSTTWDSTRDVGQTFTDAALGVSIMPLSSSIDGALVRVMFDAVPCVTAAPTVSLSPSAQNGVAGATFQYTMTVTNHNGAGCTASTITFSATNQSGWPSSFSPASVPALAPGASASTTLWLFSPSGASGSNAFNASAADGVSGQTASAAGSASILASLGVTASATYSQTSKGRSATITVRVANGSLPVAGAPVTTVTKPTGATSTLSATTGSTGVATVKYSLSRKDPSGLYNVRAVASAGGATGSGTTSFTAP